MYQHFILATNLQLLIGQHAQHILAARIVDQRKRSGAALARLSHHQAAGRRVQVLAAAADRGVAQEPHRRLERHLLQRRRRRLHAAAAHRHEGAVERHVVGDQQQMARINGDAVHLEDVLHLLRNRWNWCECVSPFWFWGWD